MKSDILMCVGGPLAGKLYQVAEDQDYIEGLIPESAPALGRACVGTSHAVEVRAKRVAYRRTQLVDANGKRLEALFEHGCSNPIETLLKDYHDQILQKEELEKGALEMEGRSRGMPRWIKCSDRLPECSAPHIWSEPVVAVGNLGGVFRLSCRDGYWQSSMAWIESGDTEIVYWAPMPTAD